MSERELQQLPNVGPAIAKMLLRLGIERPDDLRGQDAEQLFGRLSAIDGRRQDPCVLDTFSAAVDFANGEPAQPWWFYSRRRKAAAAQAGKAVTK
jgi:pathogenicity locus Cdd1 protein